MLNSFNFRAMAQSPSVEQTYVDETARIVTEGIIELGITEIENTASDYLRKNYSAQEKLSLIKLKRDIIQHIKELQQFGCSDKIIIQHIKDYVTDIHQMANSFEESKRLYKRDNETILQKVGKFIDKITSTKLPDSPPSIAQKEITPVPREKIIRPDHPILEGLTEEQKRQRAGILSLANDDEFLEKLKEQNPVLYEYLNKKVVKENFVD